MGCRVQTMHVDCALLHPSEMARPQRLPGISYVGLATYFVTACTLDRRKAFVTKDFCDECRIELSAGCVTFGFITRAYCFMPDHIHILTEAIREDSALAEFIAMWKQRTGFAWRKYSGSRLWQRGYWERMLRSEEHVLPIARYVVENPVRAGLVTDAKAYPWVGSDTHSVDDILAAAQMDLRPGWHRGGTPKGVPYERRG